jgi:hypothetical protein
MKARQLTIAIGAAIALIVPAAHAAGTRNTLHCTATHAKATASTARLPFNPQHLRILLGTRHTAQAASCLGGKAKQTAKQKPASKPAPPQPWPVSTPAVGSASTGPTCELSEFASTSAGDVEQAIADCLGQADGTDAGAPAPADGSPTGAPVAAGDGTAGNGSAQTQSGGGSGNGDVPPYGSQG